jgi:hypothetical protein
MNILQYDADKYDFDDIYDLVKHLKTDHDFDAIALPKDFDVLLDADTYTLYFFKNKIEEAIRQKEIIENM